MAEYTQQPVVRADMFIRKPAAEVFEAFVDPAITTKFWFTKSDGPLEAGKQAKWEWEMYGVSDTLHVQELIAPERIRVQWSDGTTTAWTFTPSRDGSGTLVSIANYGFAGDGDDVIRQAIDGMGGYTMVLCGLKAWLEHGVQLNLIADKAPDANVHRE